MSHLGLVLDKWEKDVLARKYSSDSFDEAKHSEETFFDKELLLEDARAYMASLPERTARICYLYYTVGHTQLEVAGLMNTTVKAVEGVLGRVNKKLRDRYGT